MIIFQSEPHSQHQKFSERHYHTIKCLTNTILDHTGYPDYMWLLELRYACLIFNHTYDYGINGIPINKTTGSAVEITPLLRFRFWKLVYYKVDDSDLPSNSTGKGG